MEAIDSVELWGRLRREVNLLAERIPPVDFTILEQLHAGSLISEEELQQLQEVVVTDQYKTRQLLVHSLLHPGRSWEQQKAAVQQLVQYEMPLVFASGHGK